MRIIIVSNRVAHEEKPQAGGLASAILNILRTRDGLWIGWDGRISESQESFTASNSSIDFRLFPLSDKEYSEYYLSFSNEIIWPVCHLRPSYLRATENTYRTYCSVNQKFAEVTLQSLHEEDVVWVHDYHLMLVGWNLRDRGFEGRMGYFHHIPIPPPELLKTIPHHETLLSGLLSYDLVGVQTLNDLKNLCTYYQELASHNVRLELEHTTEHSFQITHFGHVTQFAAYPISIDTAGIEQLAPQSVLLPEIEALRESLQQRPLAIGVDRLDYSKGLENKYHAWDKYLSRYAHTHDSTCTPVLLQIANKSRNDIENYSNLRVGLEALASQINADHGSPSYAPIRYLNTVYSHTVLTGLYRLAQVGLVTPTKDGMNLVAKEYVAAQDPEDPGVLVLSEFAGAAEELTQALLVNPFHTHSLAETIHKALHMPRAERVQRHQALMRTLRSNTIHTWYQRFLEDLGVAENSHVYGDVAS